MGAAEKATADLHPMTDYLALAMLTDGRNCLNRALEAVECVPRTSSNQFEGLIVLIPANFAFCHLAPRSAANRADELPRFGKLYAYLADSIYAGFRTMPRPGVAPGAQDEPDHNGHLFERNRLSDEKRLASYARKSKPVLKASPTKRAIIRPDARKRGGK